MMKHNPQTAETGMLLWKSYSNDWQSLDWASVNIGLWVVDKLLRVLVTLDEKLASEFIVVVAVVTRKVEVVFKISVLLWVAGNVVAGNVVFGATLAAILNGI